MIVKNLTLKNYRNHKSISFQFFSGLNIISGPNGVGKTNVVEAIYYLSLARSFKNVDNDNLVMKEADQALIDSTISSGELNRKIRIIINKGGRQILINGKPVSKVSDLSKITNVILFEPKDVLLFRGPPKNRRSFIDISISKQSEKYLTCITQYEKALKQRNDILKSENIDDKLLETSTEMIVNLSKLIIGYRLRFFKDINDILIKITRALTGVRKRVEVIYKPFVDYDINFTTKAMSMFKSNESNDLKHKTTTIGIHREDFLVNLDGSNIATYGSQGENRIVALSLKLSPYFLIEDKDKRPIVVLDDVMSELDQPHRQRLITFLKKMEQVFITATRLEVSDSKQFLLKTKNKEVI